MSHKFKGTGVAIVTPFKADRSIDFEALERLVNHLVDNQVEHIVVLGTTGESATLTKEEKNAVVDAVKQYNAGRLPLVLGIGGNNTMEICQTIEATDFEGIDAILSVSPYYNKPTQEGIYQHFKTISDVAPRPIILYNVPSRTSSNMLPDTVLRLARDCENVIAVKEASGDLLQCMEIIKNKPEGFLVLSGDDALTLPHMAIGGDGVISVVANAFPKDFSDMVRRAANAADQEAQDLHYKYLDIINLLFAEGNPGGIKAALKILGITDDHLRLPLVNISQATYDALAQEISNL